MKTLKLIIGCYLVVQAGLGALAGIGALMQPLRMISILAVSALCGYGGYWLIRSANKPKKEEPKQ